MPVFTVGGGADPPQWRSQIAAFDYDWTLVKPLDGRMHPRNVDDRQWWRPCVPEVLRNLYARGYALVVVTNQSKAWKLDAIRAQLEPLGLPITVAVGMLEAERKPARAMWDAVVAGRAWDARESFYVGDAAGREHDWSDSDKRFAEAAGLAFATPDDVFPPATPSARAFEQASTMAAACDAPEVVVMVGYPAAGKTSWANALVAAAADERYVRINGDALKSSTRMVQAARRAVAAGKSVVFDATNSTRERRAAFVAFAREVGLPARAVEIRTSIDTAGDRARARGTPYIPPVAFYTYRKYYEAPSAEGEGFASVLVVEN